MLRNGIYNEVLTLINNEELQPSTNVVISTCSAYDYLNNSIPNLEKMTVKYYETFAITSRFTGYISNISIGEFYNLLTTNGPNPTAILGGLNSTTRKELSEESDNSSDAVISPEDLTAGSSSVTGNRGSENIGIAVFKNDKFCGELTAVETICHLLIDNEIDSCIVSIDSPIEENSKIELRLVPSKKSKIKVNIENDVPHIDINLNLEADIMTLQNNVDYQSDKILEKISNSTQKYMEEQINNYLNKVCKEYGVDIDNFYTKALGHFATIPEWNNFNWEEKIKTAQFNVNPKIDVISSILITKT